MSANSEQLAYSDTLSDGNGAKPSLDLHSTEVSDPTVVAISEYIAQRKSPLTVIGQLDRPEMDPKDVIDALVPGSQMHQIQTIEATCKWLKHKLENDYLITDQHSRVAVVLSKARRVMGEFEPDVQEALEHQILEVIGIYLEKQRDVVVWSVKSLWKNEGTGLHIEDLIIEGQIGFMQGLERFDLSTGNEVIGYCVSRIRGQAVDEIRAVGGTIKTPRSVISLRRRLELEPDLLDRLPEAKRKLVEKELERFKMTRPVSLDEPIEMEEDNAISLHDLVPSDDSDAQFSEVVDGITQEGINEIVESLPYREREVLKMNLGLPPYEDEYTLAEIGRLLDVSESRASQLLTKAFQITGARLKRKQLL